MTQQPKFTRPLILEPGKIYLRATGKPLGNELLPVRFINYSACAEMIIIWNGAARERCPRRELYLLDTP